MSHQSILHSSSQKTLSFFPSLNFLCFFLHQNQPSPSSPPSPSKPILSSSSMPPLNPPFLSPLPLPRHRRNPHLILLYTTAETHSSSSSTPPLKPTPSLPPPPCRNRNQSSLWDSFIYFLILYYFFLLVFIGILPIGHQYNMFAHVWNIWLRIVWFCGYLIIGCLKTMYFFWYALAFGHQYSMSTCV